MSGPLTTFNTAIISKPFAPTQFTGLELWLRGDIGVIADSNGRVSEWRDYSGKQRHVTQATAGQQPLRVNAAKAGLPAVQFVSSRSDILVSTTSTNIDNCSIFCAIKVDVVNSSEDVFIAVGQGDNLNRVRFLYRSGANSNIGFALWGPSDFSNGTIGWDSGNYHVVGAVQTASAVTVYRDSLSETGTFGSAALTTNQNYWAIGGTVTASGNYFVDAHFGEVVIYNRAVNQSERVQILNYLRNRWQTPA